MNTHQGSQEARANEYIASQYSPQQQEAPPRASGVFPGPRSQLHMLLNLHATQKPAPASPLDVHVIRPVVVAIAAVGATAVG
eukprot:CAMPEP_0119070330 /NCGR_PEP_ID=MMETSP1178-20130426/37940_1 /TAXON_ID=33656 /ORGANISM="unid sp, Strain CCMP2000" /LENGTH=81 /DNA_ID=CAMNT_0007052157 /DNA_START=51 /DNA_END=294 /DNA_ORIENTATION=-